MQKEIWKKLTLVGLGCLALAACNRAPKNKYGAQFTLLGKINGLDSGEIYLTHRSNGSYLTDTVEVRQGAFQFSDTVSEPTLYDLGIGRQDPGLSFFVDNQVIHLTVDRDSLNAGKVSGSRAEDQYLTYLAKMQIFQSQLKHLMQTYALAGRQGTLNQMQDSLELMYEEIQRQQQDSIVSYVRDHPHSIIGAWAVSRNLLYTPDPVILGSVYQQMDTVVRRSSYGKKIWSTLVIARKTAVGQLAPDFTEADTQGKPFTLSSLRGQYVLLDFWASWCGPCRAEDPKLVQAFQQFGKKGFTVLGVSLDQAREPWLDAITSDHLDWHQVSDLKYWDSRVAREYGIRAIPANFLLDPQGRIIARNLRGGELDKKLAAVFK
ncbi:MAG: redoxin domain-containing protein [Chitinophagaceae bacterium]